MLESQKKSQIFQRKPNLNLFRESLNTCLFVLSLDISQEYSGHTVMPGLQPRTRDHARLPRFSHAVLNIRLFHLAKDMAARH